jgi:DNA repair exonuclease SbcCD ATPase subunit
MASDMTQLKALLEVVTDPTKYKAQLEALIARENKWQEIIGLGETLETVRSKLSEAEITLKSAKDKAASTIMAAQKQLEAANSIVEKQEQIRQDLAKQLLAAVETNRLADVRLAGVDLAVKKAAQETMASVKLHDECKTIRKELVEAQMEVDARIQKLKSVMA